MNLFLRPYSNIPWITFYIYLKPPLKSIFLRRLENFFHFLQGLFCWYWEKCTIRFRPFSTRFSIKDKILINAAVFDVFNQFPIQIIVIRIH